MNRRKTLLKVKFLKSTDKRQDRDSKMQNVNLETADWKFQLLGSVA